MLRVDFAGEEGPELLTLAPQLPNLRYLSLQERSMKGHMRVHDLRCLTGGSPRLDMPSAELRILQMSCCATAEDL